MPLDLLVPPSNYSPRIPAIPERKRQTGCYQSARKNNTPPSHLPCPSAQPKLNFQRNSSELRFRAPTSQFLIRFHNHNFKNFNFQFAPIPNERNLIWSFPEVWMLMLRCWRLWCGEDCRSYRSSSSSSLRTIHAMNQIATSRARGAHFRCRAFFIDDDGHDARLKKVALNGVKQCCKQ